MARTGDMPDLGFREIPQRKRPLNWTSITTHVPRLKSKSGISETSPLMDNFSHDAEMQLRSLLDCKLRSYL